MQAVSGGLSFDRPRLVPADGTDMVPCARSSALVARACGADTAPVRAGRGQLCIGLRFQCAAAHPGAAQRAGERHTRRPALGRRAVGAAGCLGVVDGRQRVVAVVTSCGVQALTGDCRRPAPVSLRDRVLATIWQQSS
jgi:hypothetical protein